MSGRGSTPTARTRCILALSLTLIALTTAQSGLAAEGDITTLAGTGAPGSGGDGGPAALAQLQAPTGIAASSDGSIWSSPTATRSGSDRSTPPG